MEYEIDRKKEYDREIEEQLEIIRQLTKRQMEDVKKVNSEYTQLVNSAIKEGHRVPFNDKQFELGIKAMEDNRRSLLEQQKELESIVKGETEQQQLLVNTQKSIKYIENGQKKLNELRNQNKLFDLRGNYERRQIAKEIKREIEKHQEFLKDNGINDHKDFDDLKKKVERNKEWARNMIEHEKQMMDMEIREKIQDKQKEFIQHRDENIQYQQYQHNKRDKGIELER